MMKKNLFSFYSIILIFIIIIYQNFNVSKWESPKGIIRYDVISYYAYLPATFVYNDVTLSFIKNYEDYKETIWFKYTPTGGKVIMTSMGLSILYSPFFFIAHNTSHFFGYEANGYTTPYAFALIFSCLFYFTIGLFFLRKLLLDFYNDKTVALTILFLSLSTNLYWYVTIEAAMSHGFNFSLFSIFLYLTHKWYRKQNMKYSILLGLIYGLISLVRPTNALIIIVFMLWNIKNIDELLIRIKLFIKNYYLIGLMIIITIIIWLPQLIYWKTVSGQFLYYSYGNEERFFWNRPHIWEVLFGFRKGLLIYNPILWLSVFGFFILWKSNKKFLLPILVFSAINLYVISSWWCWWYGGSYSLRAFIDSYPLFAIPMAAFITWLLKQTNKIKIPLMIFCLLIFIKGSFSLAQFYYRAIHYDAMTKEAYFDTFFKLRPTSNFYKLVKSPDYQKARQGIDAIVENE